MAAVAVGLFLGTPLVVWAIRHFFDYAAIEHALPKTDTLRMGYWSHAIDWIADRPLRGWGLDASRMFGPGIILHPHNNPLQVWLELGVIGAVTAAVSISGLQGHILERNKPRHLQILHDKVRDLERAIG